MIAHQPSRAHALNQASADGRELVGEGQQPEWIRIASLSDATAIETTLPPPNDKLMLKPNSDVVLSVTGPLQVRTDHPVTIVR